MVTRKSLVLFSLLAFVVLTSFEHTKKISVASFGAMPNDGLNDATALLKAMAYAKLHKGIDLYFPPGVYDFRDEKAVELMNAVMSGKMGNDPEKTIFTPYYPYSRGLDFNGLENIHVEAAGATLLIDGWMEPVSLEHCKNITIKGLTIDYKRKPHSIGKIIAVQPAYYDVVFDSIYPVTAGMAIPRMIIWDDIAKRMFPKAKGMPSKTELIAPQILRIYYKTEPDWKDKFVIIPNSFHFRPAILIHEASDIRLDEVTIHSQPGMGIVGHRSNNITMNGLRVVPSGGSFMSTNTDATHFTTCTGWLRFQDCTFEGHGDDAVNIHNYYYTIQTPAKGKGYDLLVKAKTFTHAQVLDYPDVGDTLELVKRSSLATVRKLVVRSRVNDFKELRSQVELNESLPADLENYFLINSSRLPKVEIKGCTITANLARGLLIKTRNVLIEHCLIRESTGTGIHVGAESYWHEGLPSANIVIRYNHIIRCGRGSGVQDGASGIAVKIDAPDITVPGLHKNLLIEGNIIEGENAERGISVSGADNVVIRYNEITGCKNPVVVKYSDNVHVYGNIGSKDIQEKHIQ